ARVRARHRRGLGRGGGAAHRRAVPLPPGVPQERRRRSHQPGVAEAALAAVLALRRAACARRARPPRAASRPALRGRPRRRRAAPPRRRALERDRPLVAAARLTGRERRGGRLGPVPAAPARDPERPARPARCGEVRRTGRTRRLGWASSPNGESRVPGLYRDVRGRETVATDRPGSRCCTGPPPRPGAVGLVVLALCAPAAAHASPAPAAFVRVDQVGFAPGAGRALVLSSVPETGATFAAVDATGTARLVGALGAPVQAWSGAFPYVYPIDLTALAAPG